MKIRIDLKIFIFLLIFFFTSQIKIYLIIMFFCIIHEIAHVIIGLLFGMKLEKIEVLPLGLSSSFYMCSNIGILKRIFVILAGPVMSLVLAFLCNRISLMWISTSEGVYSNILIFLFNMIPLYPLDGGRLVKEILESRIGEIKSCELTYKISYITIIILTILSSIGIYYYKNLAIFLICIFLWSKVLKLKVNNSNSYRF